MAPIGAISIYPPHIKYQPKKANAVAGAISHSQRSTNKNSIVIKSAMTVDDNQVLVLNQSGIELRADDVL